VVRAQHLAFNIIFLLGLQELFFYLRLSSQILGRSPKIVKRKGSVELYLTFNINFTFQSQIKFGAGDEIRIREAKMFSLSLKDFSFSKRERLSHGGPTSTGFLINMRNLKSLFSGFPFS